MTTNQDIQYGLSALNTTWQEGATDFFNRGMTGPMMDLATVYKSPTVNLSLAWLANPPRMTEWLGERIVSQSRSYTLSSRMKKYQKTLEIPRESIAYGQLGIAATQVAAFFDSATSEYDGHIYSKYTSSSGVGPVGYDGVALISTSHPHGPGGAVQSNHGSTANLSYSALVTADATMRLFRAENGENYGITPTHLLVGANLRVRANELMGIDRIVGLAGDGTVDGGTRVAGATKSNPMNGAMQVIVTQREAGYHWSVLDLSKPNMKPFVMQENRFPEALSLDEMTSQPRWTRDVFQYALEGDFEATSGYWQTIYKALGTG